MVTIPQVQELFDQLSGYEKAMFVASLQHKLWVKINGKWTCGCNGLPDCPNRPDNKPPPR